VEDSFLGDLEDPEFRGESIEFGDLCRGQGHMLTVAMHTHLRSTCYAIL